MNRVAESSIDREEVDTHVHAQGSGLCGTETLCGYVDTGISWADTQSPVDCFGCLDVIRMAKLANVRVKP